jgi:hypothetical protein
MALRNRKKGQERLQQVTNPGARSSCVPELATKMSKPQQNSSSKADLYACNAVFAWLPESGHKNLANGCLHGHELQDYNRASATNYRLIMVACENECVQ